MQIISHRGYWKETNEKNKEISFYRSFNLGFGTETDIRDYKGELVISHDIADESCIILDEFFKIYTSSNGYEKLPLALNIKADGLQNKLKELIEKHDIKNYFVFDMAVPDGILYVKEGLNVFTRESEYEKIPSFYDESQGVWLDAFNSEWYDEKIIKNHIDNNKMVCIVSPDLHKREYKEFWSKLKIFDIVKSDKLILCTDYPEEARDFFNE